MPQPRSISQWPTAGERKTKCILEYATPVPDDFGGRGEPTWTAFGTWYAKVLTVPDVSSESKAALGYQAEGLYRADLFEYFHGISFPPGVTEDSVGIRILANRLTLKVFQVENPLMQNRTLIAHCADGKNTP